MTGPVPPFRSRASAATSPRPRPPGAPVALALILLAAAARAEPLHYAVNLGGDYAGARAAGFNLVDVGSAAALDDLPEGVRGVLWLGNGYNTECAWRLDDAETEAAVTAARDHPRFGGIYYIADEPHPAICPDAADEVAARTELIHALDPDGRTLVLVQNGAHGAGEFEQLGEAADLIGVDPYPCNVNNVAGCDLDALRGRIRAALDSGIGPERIVPVFQAFGQACIEGSEPYYRLPSAAETEAMLGVWDALVPPAERPLDMAYSWNTQPESACPTLRMADGRGYPDLLGVFGRYFSRMKSRSYAGADHD